MANRSCELPEVPLRFRTFCALQRELRPWKVQDSTATTPGGVDKSIQKGDSDPEYTPNPTFAACGKEGGTSLAGTSVSSTPKPQCECVCDEIPPMGASHLRYFAHGCDWGETT